ncbi:uncharacterized protein LAESUDRAFT_762342 [Laetiporus sulphureus 93-53]|uniref:Uncharacterized protein n=1 Tax=Laetiporus sulphureus 93-53 TaxID=1314785 RepID=A0A165CJ99_9APHY|nr:uncharacterized protein LAESUDRAFT_762342 [Laetiporus sulphureus 93-53]KZT02911.1 hypothetical protein LAESUDRAFT_762342 [Laetiporus sulphureus 93-53]
MASVSTANLFEVSEDKASSFLLGAEDRIKALEQELFNLKQSRSVFDGVYMPLRQPAGSAAKPAQSERAPEQQKPQAEPEKATESVPSSSTPVVTNPVPEHVLHPCIYLGSNLHTQHLYSCLFPPP